MGMTTTRSMMQCALPAAGTLAGPAALQGEILDSSEEYVMVLEPVEWTGEGTRTGQGIVRGRAVLGFAGYTHAREWLRTKFGVALPLQHCAQADPLPAWRGAQACTASASRIKKSIVTPLPFPPA
jgi:hypothetical protein